MARILVTTDYLRPGDAVDVYLREHGHETVHEPMTKRRTEEELVALLDGIEGALIANEPMTAAVLSRAETLRAVVRTGVGYDSVDVAAADRLGISVSNLPGINANAVAEYTIGLMLDASRHLVALASGVAEGRWPRTDGHELRGSTLGLVGFGATARAVVPLARAFGMTILCFSSVDDDVPGVEFVELDVLLGRSDVVSLHCALNDATRGLIGARTLALMKPSALLVNTARGPIVDESALADAVRAGRIAGAALDVTAVEPLPADSVLRGIDGITVYSHMAGQTAEAREAAGREGAIELVAALKGKPRFRVDA
ncbi:phosphoglycerate dehydrogenase [Cryptosporangium sp. NPDC048952]|uniref:phosphoglycerate dehydrogenase n=1 Tax=Cryptosporangium sp. NPDC048952 TaxID=3363961 RepID=UPI0037185B4F